MSAEKLKDEGNMLFKDSNWRGDLEKYSQANQKFKEAASLLESFVGEDIQNHNSSNCKLYVVLLTNSALCSLSLKDVQGYE